ncbi:MAG: YvcK family protein [Candidatus Nomurabacteria bacterium]|nr:YvcK family protein [Candidatus Nomurabacteria bacterium]
MEKIGVNVVVIGGGTGSFTIMSGLKKYVRDITALVSMADDGGSTGQLRDELGVLPTGDVRQCLVALSESPKVRDLFNYRFESGSMTGHAFGNLFLAALEKMTGSFAEAVDLAGEVLRIDGRVVPTTLDSVELVVQDGDKTIIGESNMSEYRFSADTKPQISVRKKNGDGNVQVNPVAIQAIEEADLVVIAPGNLYRSIAPALTVSGMGEALQKTSARKIYVANLVNKPGQTDDFAVHDLAGEIERVAGGEFLNYVVYNVHQPSKKMLEKYAAEGELPVEIDAAALKSAHYKAKGAELLAGEIWHNPNAKDPIASQRTLIRHDPDAVARAIMKIYFS